jgi:hypothetical protein
MEMSLDDWLHFIIESEYIMKSFDKKTSSQAVLGVHISSSVIYKASCTELFYLRVNRYGTVQNEPLGREEHQPDRDSILQSSPGVFI